MVIIGFILIFLAALLFTSLGTLIATLMDDMQGFQLVINFLIMPTFFLSGALFPLRDLPPVMQNLVRLNPLTYGVDGVRMAFIGSGTFPLFLDFGILAIITFIILAIGTYTFNHLQA